MTTEQWDIVFRGDIVLGQSLPEVKLRLQQLFKADAARVEQLFSGRPVPLKRQLSRADAERYRGLLHKAGIEVQLSPSSAATPTPSAARPVRSAPGTAQGWTLAPVGSELLRPTERYRPVPVQIDVSQLSLRPEGGDLLDASERTPQPSSVVSVPALGVAEAGAELLSAAERQPLPVAEVVAGAWGLADLGGDLLAPSERTPVVPMVVEADFDLAPVGADLGQLAPEPAPPAPDTSGLSLVPGRAGD